jgi:hypothetical protein
MALPQAVGREDGISMWRISAIILNMYSKITDKVQSSNPEGCAPI